MPREYNKLVRDRIPEIIRGDGRECATETMPETAYRRALLAKLQEEAGEALQGRPEDLVTELADVFEVLDAIMAAFGIDQDVVLAEQARKRAERGGFERRIRLLWVEE